MNRQTKEHIFTIVKTVLGIVVVLGILFFMAYNEHHYTRMGFCKRISNERYHFYDSRGNVWEFYSDKDIDPEATVEVKMFSNCTLDNIKDDIITDYQVLDSEIKIEIEKDFNS